jgi:hypothetical protein
MLADLIKSSVNNPFECDNFANNPQLTLGIIIISGRDRLRRNFRQRCTELVEAGNRGEGIIDPWG